MARAARDLARRREAVTAERTGREGRALTDIAAAGVNITRPNLAPFVEAGRRTYAQSEERLGKDLVARVAAAARG